MASPPPVAERPFPCPVVDDPSSTIRRILLPPVSRRAICRRARTPHEPTQDERHTGRDRTQNEQPTNTDAPTRQAKMYVNALTRCLVRLWHFDFMLAFQTEKGYAIPVMQKEYDFPSLLRFRRIVGSCRKSVRSPSVYGRASVHASRRPSIVRIVSMDCPAKGPSPQSSMIFIQQNWRTNHQASLLTEPCFAVRCRQGRST